MGRDKSRSPSRKHKDKEKKEKKEKKERKDHDRDYDRGHRERSADRYERRDRPRDDYGGPPRDRDRYRDHGPPPPGDYRGGGIDLRGPPADRDYDRDRERGDRDRERDRSDRDRDRHRESERNDRGAGERRGRGDDGDDGGEPSSKRRREGSAAPGGAGAASAPGGLTGAAAAALGMTAEAVAVAARPGLTAEEAAQQRRDAEAAVLEQQAERRRKAVEEWRKKRLADQGIVEPEAQPEVKEEPVAGEAPGAAATTSNGGEGAAAAASNGDATGGGGPEAQPGEEGGEAGAGASKQKQKGWSLEDDDEDSDDGGGGGDPDEEMPDADGDGDGDALRPPPMLGMKKEQEDDDDDDPLDAFMGGLGAGGAGKGPRPVAGPRPTPGKPLLGGKFGAPVGLGAKKGFVFATPGAAAASGSAAAGAGAAAPAAAAAKPEPQPAAEAAGAGEGGAAAAAPAAAAAAKPRRKWAPVEPVAKAENGGGGDDDEVDPLDAFMAAEVLPEVHKLAVQAAQAVEDAAVAAAAAAREPSPAPGSDDMDVDGDAAAQVKPDPDLPGPSSRLSPPPVAGPSARVNGNVGPGAGPLGAAGRGGSAARRKPRAAFKRRAGSSDESSSDGSDEDKDSDDMDDAEWARLVTAGKLSKGDKLVAVDHSTIDYPPFRKNFYIEVTELTRLSPEELAELRAELDGIKVRGKNIPAPVRSWTQAGLSSRILEVLKKRGFDRPLPIQAQALPIIMSGRDCIGIAKTGSGKTGAFVLPMMRHIKDQRPLEQGDGPVALVIAPTRELVAQIAKEAKAFAKPLGLNALAVFGGSGVANQITELKRGVEIVACTPGRMIDLLVTSNGKITNLRRVTYLVMDEADRMFDMGFEPQISRIIQNIRPDRQTVMFSATFPRAVEALARKVLQDPVEIQVGGRSVVNDSITQWVELRPEKERFHRLLEILGEWYERGKLLIFVDKQESCDNLFRDLLRYGYPCLSLHGGKDQSDRESTIADFKGAVCNILVATSIAARGLDVKDLVLVVNYDVPNHHEDYVHRVGRTGRAGAKGTAITFISEEEERYAPDLVKALRESGAPVPQDLQALADSFNTKHKAGLVKAHGSGYGGSGFKFDTNEEERHRTDKKAKAKAMGLEVEGEDEAEEAALDAAVASLDADDIRPKSAANANTGSAAAPLNPADSVSAVVAAAREKLAEAAKAGLIQVPAAAAAGAMGPPGAAGAGAAAPGAAAAAVAAAAAAAAAANPLLAAAQQVAAKLTMQVTAGLPPSATGPSPQPMSTATPAAPGMPSISADALARAAAIAAKFGGTIALPGMSAGGGGAGGAAGRTAPGAPAGGFEAELEINDFPQHARWKITHRETMNQINELTGAALTVRGTYVQPGRPVPEGERKLFLLIEGPTEQHVKKAKAEIKKILEETTEKIMRRDAPAAGRYSVM